MSEENIQSMKEAISKKWISNNSNKDYPFSFPVLNAEIFIIKWPSDEFDNYIVCMFEKGANSEEHGLLISEIKTLIGESPLDKASEAIARYFQDFYKELLAGD